MSDGIKSLVVPETLSAVCLWKTSSGMLADADGNYLSLEGVIYDHRVEAKMAEAAKYWMGSEFEGIPHWVRGARQISHDEYEHQQSRLLDGLVPDELEEFRVALQEGRVK